MKKLALVFSVFVLVLTSCSSDDGNNNPILVTQAIETRDYNGSSNSYTTNFSYNGNKIISMSSGTNSINYTYTGDLITKIEYFADAVLQQEDLYSYNSLEKLINYKRFEYDDINGDYGINVDYVHNSNGTVSYTRNTGYLPNITPSSTGTINFNNEGLVSNVEASTGYTFSYTYDTKNNPFENILGVDKIFFSDDEGSSYVRNLLSRVNSDSNSMYYTAIYTYTYNSADFPTQSVENNGYETVTKQFTYNH